MPDATELILDLERQLLPIMESQVIDTKSIDNWINAMSKRPARDIAIAVRFVVTDLLPVYKDYRVVAHHKTVAQWALLLSIGEELDEVVTFKRLRKKVQDVWKCKPKVNQKGKMDAIMKVKSRLKALRDG